MIMKNKTKLVKKESYITPDMEIIVIEIEQSILSSSSGEIPGFIPEIW